MESKACTGCRIVKSLDDYPPDRRSRDGKQARCRSCINQWVKNHYHSNPAEGMLRRAATRARSNGMEFSLKAEDITPLPEFCPVFGTRLRLRAKSQDPNAYSLDRIDNSKGYVKGNVAVMSYRANRLKNDGTAQEHEAIAAWIRKQSSILN